MVDFLNIELVGTSHISPKSKARILSSFNNFKPDIICVELDRARLLGLKDKNRKAPGLSAIKHIGVLGFFFASIGGFIQKKLGKITGMVPGDEMLLGVRLAEKNKLRLDLIDQDIQVTLKKISRMPFRERFRILSDILKAPFQRKGKVKIDIANIPEEEFVLKMIAQIKDRYPYLYKVMISDRNKIMAKRLFYLSRDNPTSRILAVVGEGHISGMLDYLKKLDETNVSFISYNNK